MEFYNVALVKIVFADSIYKMQSNFLMKMLFLHFRFVFMAL